MSSSKKEPITFLTLPPELRNTIYTHLFQDSPDSPIVLPPEDLSPIAKQLQLDRSHFHHVSPQDQQSPDNLSFHLAPLLTCRQIHHEAHLLALSSTRFSLPSTYALPDLFDLRSRTLSPTKLRALKHLTLTAKTSHLRALNEAWDSLPFGHPSLRLETLTIVPTRADARNSAYAEVADLSQSHTLAYVFAETLKGLRNVGVLTVVNEGCFNEVVWRLVYRSLVYRMYRWGGICCGVRFECSEDEEKMWFRAFLEKGGAVGGREVGEEVCRLLGREGMDPFDAQAEAP